MTNRREIWHFGMKGHNSIAKSHRNVCAWSTMLLMFSCSDARVLFNLSYTTDSEIQLIESV